MRYPILAVRLVLAAGIAMLAACSGNLLQVDVFVVGERTSLEKQVLGTYRSLGDDFQPGKSKCLFRPLKPKPRRNLYPTHGYEPDRGHRD